MEFEALVKQLANRINQPHVIEHYLKMVWRTAVKETETKQCTIHSVSNRFSDPKFIDNVCLSYRHDFGLLSEQDKDKVRFECKEWMRAIKNNEPY